MRLLCVEDKATLCKMIELMLAVTGIDLEFTSDRQGAVEAYQLAEFDALLIDMDLPDKAGLKAAHDIRQMEDGFHLGYTPILFLGGHPRDEDIAWAFESGGDGHLVKPFTSEALIGALDRVLRTPNQPGLTSLLRLAR